MLRFTISFILVIAGFCGCGHLRVRNHVLPGPHDQVRYSVAPEILNLDAFQDTINAQKFPIEGEIYGTVVLRIAFDNHGKYVKHIVLKDPHPWLTKVYVDHVAILTAKPGEIKGRAVSSWITVPVDVKISR